MHLPRAVIFDMDGLLIDSEPLWVRAEIDVFGDAGIALTEEDCAKTKGLRIDDVVAYWEKQRGFRAGDTAKDVETRLVARVIHLITWEGRALPGIASAIAAAKKSGRGDPLPRPIAVASSSPVPIIAAALERLGLADGTFDVVQSAQTEPFGKPHPGIFLTTADRLGVSPLECVVIEDSMNGVLAAKAARMPCIAIPFDHPNHDARFIVADAVVSSLADVTTELLSRVCEGAV